MTSARVRLLTAVTGLVGAVLLLGALLLPTNAPGFGALPEQIARWTLDDRRRLLVASVFAVMGLAVLVAFFAGLRALVGRAEGAPALLATIAYDGFLIAIALAFVSVALLQTQSFVALDGDPGWVRTLHEARFLVGNVAAAPTIVSAVAFAVVMIRTGFPARWIGWGSALVAVVHVPALFALSSSGVLSPTSGLAQLAPLVFAGWVLAVSVTLLVSSRSG